MISKLYLKDNYLNKKISLINNSTIIEYDLKEAGLNILYSMNIIKDSLYKKIKSMEKKERNIFIGNLLRKNPKWTESLMEGFKEVRKTFFELNKIQDNDILSIKKDAIFIIDKYIEYTQINDYLEFRPKGQYTTFLNIGNKEHFLNLEKKLEVKGYSKELIEFQKDYFFKFIERIMNLILANDKDSLYTELAYFKDDFINFKLSKEFYKDIKLNEYLISCADTILSLPEINEDIKKHCMTNNNLSYIDEIIRKVL